MIRKLVLGTLLVGLIGALAAGAVIRTLDRTDWVAEAAGIGQGRNSEATAERGGRGQGADGDEAKGGGVQGAGGTGNNYGRGGEQGSVEAPGDGTGSGQAVVDEWVQVTVTIVSVDENALVGETAEGERITVENRAWLYALEQEFETAVGHQVTLSGFYEDGEFEVGQLDDLTSNKTVALREAGGRPLWAGRGRGGRGQGGQS